MVVLVEADGVPGAESGRGEGKRESAVVALAEQRVHEGSEARYEDDRASALPRHRGDGLFAHARDR